MFAKLVVLCVLAVMASSTPTEYPAGLHPSVCPNYPHCDLETLLRHTPDGTPIPEWELNHPLYSHFGRTYNPYRYTPYAYTNYPHGRFIGLPYY